MVYGICLTKTINEEILEERIYHWLHCLKKGSRFPLGGVVDPTKNQTQSLF